MRNLKKILALVLALMMALSVMVFASAANYDDYSDKDQISEEYAEAVEVLTGMDIFWGSENSFYPKENVSRAEVATLLYRIMTTDVSGSQVGIYKDYGMFDDVLETNWFAGYVNFAANSEYVVGVGDGKFNPEGDVTGYEWITMLLRAVGYDANGEISGSEWKITAARLAKQAGILGDFNETTLNSALTREEVAYLLFNAINVPQVDYTPAFGYDDENVWGVKNPTIGEDQFNLTESVRTTVDAWGRPGHTWTYSTGNKVTVIKETPVATYTTAVAECDIAAAVGFSGTVEYTTYINGVLTANVGKYNVQATDTVTRIGAQGRLTEVYGKDRIVMIDTMLAQVTNVTNYKADAAGHVYIPARLTLMVFDKDATTLTGGTTITLESYTSNYSYTVGQMLLVNAYTSGTNSAVVSTAANGHGNVVNTPATQHVEIIGAPTTVVGNQTVIHYNDGKHTINGTDYMDANCLHLDQAQKDVTQHTWYFDQYNNLIGVTDIAAVYNYGTIKNIQWINPVGAPGYAQATLVLMDGSEVTKTVVGLNGNTLAYMDAANQTQAYQAGSVWYISTSMTVNNNITGDGLYQINEAATGVSLKWVNRTDVQSTVADSGRMTNASITNKQAYINGTAMAPANDSTIVTDEATQYLVRTGVQGAYVYTPVTSVNNIGNYTGATVDYVDVDNDGRAEYVYFWGNDVDAIYTGLFYPTTLSYREVLVQNSTAVDYYVMTGYVDGGTSVTEMIIPAADKTDTLDVILVGGANQLYMIDFVNGKATVAEKVTATAAWIDQNYGKYSNPDQAAFYGDMSNGATARYQDGVLTMSGFSFYVTDATEVFGSLADGVYNYHDIYVVYTDVGHTHYATEIYVADKTYTPTDPGHATTGTVVYNLHIVNKDTGAVLQTYSKALNNVPATQYTNNVLTGIAPYVGVSTTNLVAWGQADITFDVYAGAITTVNAYAYYAN